MYFLLFTIQGSPKAILKLVVFKPINLRVKQKKDRQNYKRVAEDSSSSSFHSIGKGKKTAKLIYLCKLPSPIVRAASNPDIIHKPSLSPIISSQSNRHSYNFTVINKVREAICFQKSYPRSQTASIISPIACCQTKYRLNTSYTDSFASSGQAGGSSSCGSSRRLMPGIFGDSWGDVRVIGGFQYKVGGLVFSRDWASHCEQQIGGREGILSAALWTGSLLVKLIFDSIQVGHKLLETDSIEKSNCSKSSCDSCFIAVIASSCLLESSCEPDSHRDTCRHNLSCTIRSHITLIPLPIFKTL
jgi:hypothetical protein